MRTGRVEAFSDGVIAILITIMVLELPKPEEPTWAALGHSAPVLLAYLLSFVYLGIYWNNHHHLFQLVSHIRGAGLWANLGLLFCLSLVPFATGWMSEQRFATVPVIVYGLVILLSGAAYFVLSRVLIAVEGRDSPLAAAVGADRKGLASLVLYVAGILLTLVSPWIGIALYTAVALIWLVPDRRVERMFTDQPALQDAAPD